MGELGGDPVTETGDLDQYGVVFLYDPRYEAAPGKPTPPKINWITSVLLDIVIAVEGPRFERGGPYTHACLSAYPKKVDVSKSVSNARCTGFADVDSARGFQVYPHLDQTVMSEVFGEACEAAGPSNRIPEWSFHTPSLLWLMVIGLLGEGRLWPLGQLLAHVVPNMKGVFCSELVADALWRFSEVPFCVYADEARIRRFKAMSERGFKTRVQRLNEFWNVDAAAARMVTPDDAWDHFQALDLAEATNTFSACQGPPDDQGRELVAVGYCIGQIPPHLVGLSEIANSPCLGDPIDPP
jgi:hypothetical protein